MLAHRNHGGRHDDDGGKQLDDDGDGDAERESQRIERCVQRRTLVVSVHCHGIPLVGGDAFGGGQHKPEQSAGDNGAENLRDDVADAVPHLRLRGEHGGHGDGRVELCAGDSCEDCGHGRVDHADADGDEGKVHVIERRTESAHEIDGEADEQGPSELGECTRPQIMPFLWLD